MKDVRANLWVSLAQFGQFVSRPARLSLRNECFGNLFRDAVPKRE
jgi:hypothetical protein